MLKDPQFFLGFEILEKKSTVLANLQFRLMNFLEEFQEEILNESHKVFKREFHVEF